MQHSEISRKQLLMEMTPTINHSKKIMISSTPSFPTLFFLWLLLLLPSQISVPLTKLPQAKVKRPSIGNSFALELPDNTNPLSNAAPPNFSDWPSYKFLLLIETSCPGGGLHIVTQFTDEGGLSDEEGPQFNNLVVDKNTGRVYIGAVNKLYQLSPNLEQMVRDDTVITYSSFLASFKNENINRILPPHLNLLSPRSERWPDRTLTRPIVQFFRIVPRRWFLSPVNNNHPSNKGQLSPAKSQSGPLFSIV